MFLDPADAQRSGLLPRRIKAYYRAASWLRPDREFLPPTSGQCEPVDVLPGQRVTELRHGQLLPAGPSTEQCDRAMRIAPNPAAREHDVSAVRRHNVLCAQRPRRLPHPRIDLCRWRVHRHRTILRERSRVDLLSVRHNGELHEPREPNLSTEPDPESE